jgi:hypothetical protein
MDGFHNPALAHTHAVPTGSNAKTCEETWARMRLQMLSNKHPEKTIQQLAKMVGLTPVEADKFLNLAMNRLNL